VALAKTAPFEDATANAFHLARPAAAAVGLGRWRPNGPERLPSARPKPCDSGWLDPLVVHLRSLTPHPVARREPLPASSKARLVASSYLAVRLREPPCRCQPDISRDVARKMRFTDFCNRLPSRAPTDCSIPGRTLSCRTRLATCHDTRVPAHPRPKPSARRCRRAWEACRPACRMNPPDEASLDGEPPASTIPATTRSRAYALTPASFHPGFGGGAPNRDKVNEEHFAVLVESRSLTPPRRASRRTALFAPGRACDIASDVLCRGLRRARHCCRAPSALRPPDPLPPRPRQRPRIRRARTPSVVRVLPPPVVLFAYAPARGITRSPPPVSLLACSWLSPPRTGFRRPFTPVRDHLSVSASAG